MLQHGFQKTIFLVDCLIIKACLMAKLVAQRYEKGSGIERSSQPTWRSMWLVIWGPIKILRLSYASWVNAKQKPYTFVSVYHSSAATNTSFTSVTPQSSSSQFPCRTNCYTKWPSNSTSSPLLRLIREPTCSYFLQVNTFHCYRLKEKTKFRTRWETILRTVCRTQHDWKNMSERTWLKEHDC